jgi:hypothetical protein
MTKRRTKVDKPDTSVGGRYANTARWTTPFLAALRENPSVEHACRVAGVARSAAYERRAIYPAFADAWADALEEGIDELQSVVFKRAIEGSDRCVMFLLRAHRPAIYGNSYRPPPVPPPESEPLDLSLLTPEECAELDRLVAKLAGR